MAIATAHDKIHAEIFKRINEMETKFDDMSGYMRGVMESNQELIKLLKKALHILAGITATCVLACLFAVIYGAIGKDGLHSVRKTMPGTVAVFPWTDDLADWHRG